ncbi:MAG: N-acetyltransferase family protein [Planctomycetota bacterium]|nr:MAG: N-acetyltransferase family protein [Planctomycetota bacterium]
MPRTNSALPPRHVIACTSAHLPAIREIYNDAILHTTALYEYAPRTDEMICDWFESRQRDGIPVLGIEWEPGVLAGFVTWGPFRPRPAYKYSAEHSVYVAERFRGNGLGGQLLEAIVAAARRHDLHMLVAGIDATNAASIALHKSLGFRLCGTVREAGFKFGRWLDLEFWQLLLPTPQRPVDG